MKYGYTDNKQAILKRLNRAEGQVRGVARMVENDEYCIDILTQINAIQAAVDKVAIELMRDHAKHCMMHAKDAKERDKKAEELVDAISRMMRR